MMMANAQISLSEMMLRQTAPLCYPLSNSKNAELTIKDNIYQVSDNKQEPCLVFSHMQHAAEYNTLLKRRHSTGTIDGLFTCSECEPTTEQMAFTSSECTPNIDINPEDETDGVFKHFEIGGFLLKFRRKNPPLTMEPSGWQNDSEVVARGCVLKHHYSEDEKLAICARAHDMSVALPKFVYNTAHPDWGTHFDHHENEEYFFGDNNCVETFFDSVHQPVLSGSEALTKLEYLDMTAVVMCRFKEQGVIPPGISVSSQADSRFRFVVTDRAEALKSDKIQQFTKFINQLTPQEKIEMTRCTIQQINTMRKNKWIPDGVICEQTVEGQYRLTVSDVNTFNLNRNRDNSKISHCLTYLDEVPQQKRSIELVNSVVCNTRITPETAKQLKNQIRYYLSDGEKVSFKNTVKATNGWRNTRVYLQIKDLESLAATPGGAALCMKMVWSVKRGSDMFPPLRELSETLERVEKRGLLHRILPESGTLGQTEILKMSINYRIPHTDYETLYNYIDLQESGPLHLNWDRLRFTDLSSIEMHSFCDDLLKKHAGKSRIQYYDLASPAHGSLTKFGISLVKYISP